MKESGTSAFVKPASAHASGEYALVQYAAPIGHAINFPVVGHLLQNGNVHLLQGLPNAGLHCKRRKVALFHQQTNIKALAGHGKNIIGQFAGEKTVQYLLRIVIDVAFRLYADIGVHLHKSRVFRAIGISSGKIHGGFPAGCTRQQQDKKQALAQGLAEKSHTCAPFRKRHQVTSSLRMTK